MFEKFGRCFVSYPPSYDGDPLVVFNGGCDVELETASDGERSLRSGSQAGSRAMLAADGWSTASGANVLETQDAEAVDFV